MIVVQLPKPNVYDIEVLVAEKIRVEVDVRFCFNIEQALEDVGLLELSKAHLVIVFPIGYVKHAMDHAERVPFLKLRGVFKEVQAGMDLEDLLEKHLKIVWGRILLLGLGTDEVEGTGLRGLGLEVLP